MGSAGVFHPVQLFTPLERFGYPNFSRKRTIGSTKDWFPSRRSVASHRGGFSMVLEGHCRSGRSSGLNDRYLVDGSLSLYTSRAVSGEFLGRLTGFTYIGILTHSD